VRDDGARCRNAWAAYTRFRFEDPIHSRSPGESLATRKERLSPAAELCALSYTSPPAASCQRNATHRPARGRVRRASSNARAAGRRRASTKSTSGAPDLRKQPNRPEFVISHALRGARIDFRASRGSSAEVSDSGALHSAGKTRLRRNRARHPTTPPLTARRRRNATPCGAPSSEETAPLAGMTDLSIANKPQLPRIAVGENHLCRYVIRPFVRS
jgi:hypothetical protein